jgi:tetratricopeptide (TPR) repeat protein
VRATVWTDPALAKQARRFVWLSINAEDAKNAAFVERSQLLGYPTFLVIDPSSEAVALRWLGGLTVPQVERLLDDGERAVAAIEHKGGTDPLVEGDRLAADGKFAEATVVFEKALGSAEPKDPRRARIVESLVGALSQTEDGAERCAMLAAAEAPALERGPTFASIVASGFGCASGAPKEAVWKETALQTLVPLVEEALTLESILADDRSSLYGELVGYRKDAGDEAGSKALAERWLKFIEEQSAKAKDVEARAAFDSHRVAAALELGDPARAIPALEASERDLPKDYNPAARLAVLYRAAGRLDDALHASDRALARAYGPRKLRIYLTRAEILQDKGDGAARKRALEEALAYAGTLPEAQRPKRLVEQIEAKLSG